MLTFRTITNEQIRDLRASLRQEIERMLEIVHTCDDALAPRAGQCVARARCAEIINAQGSKS